ncbi:MAG: amino acid--tRNA ligase-related protein [Lachnospiraceae bacterium]
MCSAKYLGAAAEGHMRTELLRVLLDRRFPDVRDRREESGELEFCHNPFSMPQGGLDALENKDPLDIYAYQYDLVCNGVELSSGAVRNHDPGDHGKGIPARRTWRGTT